MSKSTTACAWAACFIAAVACGGDSSTTTDGGVDGSQNNDGAINTNDSSSNNDSGDSGNAGCDAGAPDTTFPSTSTIYQDISGANIDAQWSTLQAVIAGGWGSPFQLDPSFTVNYADNCVARRTFTQDPSAQPDCDTAPIPVPAGGATEGNANYFCSNPGDDCHLLVYQGTRLYELYQGSITGGQSTGGTFTGTCLVVWDLTHDYWQPGTPFSRGDGCNGADAADMPIAPLLLKKAEIAAHSINHAMRFTIDNSKIDSTYYVHPTTHLGGGGTPMQTLPYGTRLRLKQSYNVAGLPNAEAQAVAVALQKYGMFLDDGGNFFVSATTDITDVIDTHDLKALLPTDFEMVDGGTRYDFHKQTCSRTVITN